MQELTQRVWKARPVYTLSDSCGPEHAKKYTVTLTLPDGRQVEWTERSMRKAEQGAAAQALRMLETQPPEF